MHCIQGEGIAPTWPLFEVERWKPETRMKQHLSTRRSSPSAVLNARSAGHFQRPFADCVGALPALLIVDPSEVTAVDAVGPPELARVRRLRAQGSRRPARGAEVSGPPTATACTGSPSYTRASPTPSGARARIVVGVRMPLAPSSKRTPVLPSFVTLAKGASIDVLVDSTSRTVTSC